MEVKNFDRFSTEIYKENMLIKVKRLDSDVSSCFLLFVEACMDKLYVSDIADLLNEWN